MIDETAKVIESLVPESARIYKNTILKRCTLGENCIIGDMAHVEDSELGSYTQVYPCGVMYSSKLGDYSYIQKNGSIWYTSIGKYCSLSWNVSVGGGEHDFHKVTAHPMLYSKAFGYIDEPIYDRFSEKCEIGNDVWIASGATVLRGVIVGDGAVIGAGAVVTKNVEPYSIVAGVPAKKIGQRCSDDLIAEMLGLKWWDWPRNVIKMNIELFSRELSVDIVEKLKTIKELC